MPSSKKLHFCQAHGKDQTRCTPSQCEKSLHCNDVSHWLGAYLDWSLPWVEWLTSAGGMKPDTGLCGDCACAACSHGGHPSHRDARLLAYWRHGDYKEQMQRQRNKNTHYSLKIMNRLQNPVMRSFRSNGRCSKPWFKENCFKMFDRLLICRSATGIYFVPRTFRITRIKIYRWYICNDSDKK